MATFTANLASDLGKLRAYTPSIGGQVFLRRSEYDLAAYADAADIFEMVPVFAGERVLQVQLICNEIMGGANTALDVGDGDDPARYIDGSGIGITGGITVGGVVNVATAALATARDHVYAEDDTIDILMQAGTTLATGGHGHLGLNVLLVSR